MLAAAHMSQNARVGSDDQSQGTQSLCSHKDSSSIQRDKDYIQDRIECVAKTLSGAQLFGQKINARRIFLRPGRRHAEDVIIS